MNFKRKIKLLLEHATGRQIYVSRFLPRGVNIFQDIQNSLPNFSLDTVFDVGANVGRFPTQIFSWYPIAQVYCFEPVTNSFEALCDTFEHNTQVKCFRVALSSSCGDGTMVLQPNSVTSFLISGSEASSKHRPVTEEKLEMLSKASRRSRQDQTKTESVTVLTLDKFCTERNIDRINYLKVDTEGADLDVLLGASDMLAHQKIDLVQVEAGIDIRNKYHVPFQVLAQHLGKREYYLFGIYDQETLRPSNASWNKYANPVFISQNMLSQFEK